MNTLKKMAYRPSLNNIFDDLFGGSLVQQQQQPMTNIQETPEAFVLELLAPGRKKEDFNIELKDQLLTVSTLAKESPNAEAAHKWLRREFSLGQWQRSFTLKKDSIQTEAIEAKYEDGILRLRLPKVQTKQQELKRIIEVG
jgi:HSP20 family protein